MLSVLLFVYLLLGVIIGVVVAPEYKYMSDDKRTYVQLIVLAYPLWITLKVFKFAIHKICKVV
ncbi:hypothetical protein [Acinetobacter phage vB_AP_P1489]|uniref:Uncharacterized protein n=1 Tax=Acinetobacter phage vB_AP_P1489 TaxID=3032263 RepID=A0AA49EP84_9CAUD|nr:hypothetical protein [Acinetobacter phage vB_AP_P1489]